MRVVKMRGIPFKGGFHDFIIERGGLEIFPRLVAAEHHKDFEGDFVAAEMTELRYASGRRLGARNECPLDRSGEASANLPSQ